jgi:hypothetical protein
MTGQCDDRPRHGGARPGAGRPRTMQDKLCVVCGRPFHPTKGNANRYCSRACMLKVGGNRRSGAPWPRA